MTGPYATFAELAQHEQRRRDYAVRSRWGSSGILVMAPHGGGIEPGTDILAAAAAGRRHAFYGFIGLKPRDNRRLHITSRRFDEPVARRMARRALWILTLHGWSRGDTAIGIGGRDRHGRRLFQRYLQAAGFQARISRRTGLGGRHTANLCNRGRRGSGVQLEIARGLRQPIVMSAGRHPLARRLVRALTGALAALAAEYGEPAQIRDRQRPSACGHPGSNRPRVPGNNRKAFTSDHYRVTNNKPVH